jgi:molybdate transport system ATP-binding protein
VVLEGVVAERDEKWHLERVEFPGGSIWMRDRALPIGHHVRVRIPSGGISLSCVPQQDSSILNTLAGVVEAIGDDDHPAHSLVRVKIGESVLLARITKRSVAALDLHHGLPVWAQIKSVAVAQ